MKKSSIIRIAAAAAGALLIVAGCAVRLDPAEGTGGGAIGFTAGSALLRDDATKAPLTTPVHLGVFCYKQPGTVGSPGAWNATRKPDYMFNLDVNFDGSS